MRNPPARRPPNDAPVLYRSRTKKACAMAWVKGDLAINRPVEEVFDFVADERTEPRYSPRMLRAEKISPGPIGVGTRFGAETGTMRGAVEMMIEVTAYERPGRLGRRPSCPRWTSVEPDLRSRHRRDSNALGVERGAARPLEANGPMVAWMGWRKSKQSGPTSSVSSRLARLRLLRVKDPCHQRLALTLVRGLQGDLREWGEIRGWATGIADVLKSRAVNVPHE